MSRDLVRSLILLSEKAGRIARACRQDAHLLSLLVQEKSETEKNPRFCQDFKTLADVLVQEVVRHEIGEKFPDLNGFIYGEESNSFSNAAGDSIIVSIGNQEADTESLLNKVLAGDGHAARLLASEVHSIVQTTDVCVSQWPDYNLNIPLTDLAIWIDPIDSTAEYINGGWTEDSGIQSSGLACVTILIGVFNRVTGLPVAGVINQPFNNRTSEELWKGQTIWGVSFNGENICSTKICDKTDRSIYTVAVSGSERQDIKSKLATAGFSLIEPAGAGYKFLNIITGAIDGYVLSKSSTYFWDTCGCHAILKSQNGTVIKYTSAIESGNKAEIVYQVKTETPGIESYCNLDGIIAYRNEDIFIKIMNALKHL